MNRDQVEAVLRPIWIGFAAAEERLEALLAESQSNPLDRGNAAQGLRHESDLEAALRYLRARKLGFQRDGLMAALDTGRGVLLWPNVYPGSEASERAGEAWRAARAAKDPKVQPLRREA
jgi:hypothetical protein